MNFSHSTLSFRSLLITVLVAAPGLAQDLKPFTNGTVANADDVNANFNALKTAAAAAQATANAAVTQTSLNELTTTVTAQGNSLNKFTSAIAIDANRRVCIGDNATGVGSFVPSLRIGRQSSNDNLDLLMRRDAGGWGWNFGVVNGPVGVGAELRIASVNPAGAFSSDQVFVSATGNVGIGVSSPINKLAVAGSIKIRTNDLFIFGDLGEESDSIWMRRQRFGPDETILEMRLGDNGGSTFGNDAFLITSGATLGTTLFQFNTQLSGGSAGQALKNGGGSWGSLSDARLKHDIQPLKGSLDRIMQLHGRTYYYDDTKAAGSGPGQHTGFVAQEVEKVFPEWIGTTSKGMKTLNITGFEALAVESIRELRSEKDAQIAALQSDNAHLKARLEKIEAMLATQSPTTASK